MGDGFSNTVWILFGVVVVFVASIEDTSLGLCWNNFFGVSQFIGELKSFVKQEFVYVSVCCSTPLSFNGVVISLGFVESNDCLIDSSGSILTVSCCFVFVVELSLSKLTIGAMEISFGGVNRYFVILLLNLPCLLKDFLYFSLPFKGLFVLIILLFLFLLMDLLLVCRFTSGFC